MWMLAFTRSVDKGLRRHAKEGVTRSQRTRSGAGVPPGGGACAGAGPCEIQEHRLGQPGQLGRPGLEWAALPVGNRAVGVPRPQAERSGPLSSAPGLPERSPLQRAGAAPRLTVSYLWF